ncbi:MAG: hypothetical protein IJ247_06530 [Bacilli bacterium]|nr:hypothetical protein [Bacilli bacterium]
MHDIRDVISIVSSKRFDSFSSLSSFDDCIRSKRQGIISFWNRTNGSGDIKIDDGAHTIYIRKEQNKYLCFNASLTKVEFESYSSVIADVEEKVSKQYIWGYVINAQ